MKELTKAEEQIMQEIWNLGETNVKSIIEKLAEPKPAYNTVSTIVRILETKAYVDHRKVGKGYVYFPIIDIEDYKKAFMKGYFGKYFKGSLKELVSFFAKEENIDINDFDALMKEVRNEIKK